MFLLVPDDKKGVDRASTVIARETNEGMWPCLHCVVISTLQQMATFQDNQLPSCIGVTNNELDIWNFVSNVVTLWKKCQVTCKIFLQSLWGIKTYLFLFISIVCWFSRQTRISHRADTCQFISNGVIAH